MEKINFANPEYFYLMLILPILGFLYFWKFMRQNPRMTISSGFVIRNIKKSLRIKLRHTPFILLLFGMGLIITALARPQTSSTKKEIQTEGVDIVIALDVSTSMLAEDLKPNRIEAAKKNAVKFIESRINDRIGLVVFSGESFTQCPITIDHSILKGLIDKIKSGMIEDGTAIGMGLATSVARLKDSKSRSKVIVLLTDGINNMGFVSPQTAAEIAKTFNIRVYTIGVGTRGLAPYPFKTQFGTQYQNVEVQIDEKILKEIASITGGKYFRATNSKSLESIYKEIDELEKTKIDVAYFTKKNEEYLIFGIIGTSLILLSVILRYSLFSKFP